MADNISIKDGAGVTVSVRTTDDGSGNQIGCFRPTNATGTTFAPTMDAVARPGFQKITDGTNTLPTMDVAGRKGFVAITDGTNTITVKAASTGAQAADTALVVRPMMPTDGTNTQPAADAVARSLFAQLSDGTTGPAFVTPASTAAVAGNKALVVALHPTSPVTTNADAALAAGTAPSKAFALAGQFLAYGSLPAATTGQTMAIQTDVAGTQKVGIVPLGTSVVDSHTGAATATTCTLPAVASKMNYLSGLAITGLGATAAGSIQVTTTGLAANLTFTIPIPVGATIGITPLIVNFPTPLPASAVNTAITVVVPSFGSGNTVASASAWGILI